MTVEITSLSPYCIVFLFIFKESIFHLRGHSKSWSSMFERAFEALALRFGKIEIRSSFISYGEKISFYIHILRLLCLKKKVF